MKISYSWLKDYIEIDETAEEIGDILTQTGLEVESIERIQHIPGGLEGLIVGEVLECETHPNADKLKLTKVDVGSEEPLAIVCGAPNVAKGLKVVVAPVNTTIYPTEGEPFKIKKSKIRGEVSEGMLCAEDEIGLGTSHAGLMVLDADRSNGTPIRDLFDPGEDFVFEIGLTPNRGDATGHLGAARDLRAYFQRGLKNYEPTTPEPKEGNPIQVQVEDTDACPRYSGATIQGIKVAPSPDWLQKRLRSIGLSPINNIVDITNYVLMALGQPMHAFDADQIKSGQVVVKTLPSGTPFRTLDDVERKLHADDLMICNSEEGMCIAGVFGGISSGVKDSTVNVFLESAFFSADSIRATATRQGLSTDASFRYERGTDPEITLTALDMAVNMVLEIAGGTLVGPYIDIYPKPVLPVRIPTTFQNFHRLIGIEIPDAKITSILNGLDILTENQTMEGFTAVVPPYRSDVTREADLVEEVLRIYGFNNVPLEESFAVGHLASFDEKEPHKLREHVSLTLAGKGLNEIQTNSLTNPKYHADLKLGNDPVEILNKSSEDLGYLKTSLLYTGLESIRHNINRKSPNLRFFEFGKTYEQKDKKHKEQELLAIYLTGDSHTDHWHQPARPMDMFDLSGIFLGILDDLKISQYSTQPSADDRFMFGLDIVFNTKTVATLGKLKRPICKYYGIGQEVFYGEILWPDLMRAAYQDKAYRPISKFPEVKRDLSLVLPKHINYEEVKRLAFKSEKKLLTRMQVFSVYEGDKLEEGKKSYAVSFYLQDQYHTLTDKVIDKSMNGLIKTFEKEAGAIIRK